MKKAILLAALLLQVVTGFCRQDQADSLFTVLKKQPADSSSKAFYNFYLGLRAYTASGYDSALYYLGLCRNSARRLKNDTLQIKVLNLTGDVFGDKGDNPAALKLYQEAVFLAEKMGNREMQARIIKNIGVLYVSWQKLAEAKLHYDSALQ